LNHKGKSRKLSFRALAQTMNSGKAMGTYICCVVQQNKLIETGKIIKTNNK
jgi:hypothetical protein